MPRQPVPPRFLKTMVERVRDDAEKRGAKGAQKITVERVEQVLPGNRVVVRGANVPVTGTGAGIQVGQRVGVAWEGGSPAAAIFHHAQSAQFVPPLAGGGGIVEELLIADDGGKQDVWFRNFEQLTSLKLRVPNGDGVTHLSEDPKEVFWGANQDVLAVRTGAQTYHVFRIDRASKTKVIRKGARVKEKLYTVDLSTVSVDVCNVTAHWSRNSSEKYVKLDWTQDGSLGPFIFQAATLMSDAGNFNIADVTRSLTIRLTGTTGVSYVNGSPIPASEIVVPSGVPPQSLKASLQGAFVDETNELVYSVKLSFVDWGVWQGNSTTGLTGSYQLLGPGALVNAGVCFVNGCPHLFDVQAVQDFMDHGNPSGVVATHITETHSVLIKARAASKVFSTLAENAALELVETSDGAAPYRRVDYTGMPVIADQCYTVDAWSSPSLIFTYSDVNVGFVGDVGLLKSERSLFDPSVGFTPDLPGGNDPTPATPTRWAVIRANVPQSGYDREWQDTFGQVCGTFSGNAPAQVKVLWNSDSVGVFDRYLVDVKAVPFHSAGGAVYQFVSVFRTAKRPAGYPNDLNQYGVFVLKGNAAVTVVPYTDVPATDTDAPTFMTGNSKRVLWKRGSNWFMADFAGNQAQVGDAASAGEVLVLTNPDFLYDTDEEKRFFVSAWNRATGAITMQQSAAGFPKSETALKAIAKMKTLGNVSPPGPAEGSYGTGVDLQTSWQTIKDDQLLPAQYKKIT